MPEGLRDVGTDLAEGVVEVLAGLVLLLIAAGVAAGVRQGWAQSPAATVAVVLVVAGAELVGLLHAVRSLRSHRRVRCLPALALGVAGLLGWGVGTAAFYDVWW